jgi:hypothetical protein
MSGLIQEQQQSESDAGALQVCEQGDGNLLDTLIVLEGQPAEQQGTSGGMQVEIPSDEPFDALCVGEKPAANETLQSIADETGLRDSRGDGTLCVGDGAASDSPSTQGIAERLRADHARAVRARLPKDGIFHLENGVSSLAGADVRGADLTLFNHPDGTQGFKIEVPIKGAKEGNAQTETVLLSEWLQRAKKDEIKTLLQGMVFQDVQSAEHNVTNFGGNNQAIINKLCHKNISKAFDHSPLDPTKNYSGYQEIDPDALYHPDKWAGDSGKADYLTPREYQHKMAIQSRMILKNYDAMDKWVRDEMLNGTAVKNAMEQMMQGLIEQGKYNKIFAPEGEQKAGQNDHRAALRKKFFGDEGKINRRLEAFFRRAYIAEQANRTEVKDAVNQEYGSKSPEERSESLREGSVRTVKDSLSQTGFKVEMGNLQKHELLVDDQDPKSRLRANLKDYYEAVRNPPPDPEPTPDAVQEKIAAQEQHDPLVPISTPTDLNGSPHEEAPPTYSDDTPRTAILGGNPFT